MPVRTRCALHGVLACMSCERTEGVSRSDDGSCFQIEERLRDKAFLRAFRVGNFTPANNVGTEESLD